jgi:hypothetical protein
MIRDLELRSGNEAHAAATLGSAVLTQAWAESSLGLSPLKMRSTLVASPEMIDLVNTVERQVAKPT